MKIVFAKGEDKNLNARMEEFIKSLKLSYEIEDINIEFLPSSLKT